MREYWELFWTFFRMGACTFGGGYAMLPLLQREVVEKRRWATEEELLDYYAVGQCTPGIIAVNTATFIGSRRKGVAGGILATLGFVCPSFIVILLIAALLHNYADLPLVRNAFAGIRICVCVLIINAVAKLWKRSVTDAFGWTIFLAVFLLTAATQISPAFLVVGAAGLGILTQVLGGRKA